MIFKKYVRKDDLVQRGPLQKAENDRLAKLFPKRFEMETKRYARESFQGRLKFRVHQILPNFDVLLLLLFKRNNIQMVMMMMMMMMMK